MVSTRHHPRPFPESPSGAAASTATSPKTPASASSLRATSPNTTTTAVSTPRRASPSWSHTPPPLALGWIILSAPIVLYDAAYILTRPASMRGGWLFRVFAGYEWYARVDHVYGWPALLAGDGWPGAQSAMNLVETAGYLLYLYIVLSEARAERRTTRRKGRKGAEGVREWAAWVVEPGSVYGRVGAAAAVLGFATAGMTLNKTALYWLNEAYSGFKHVGHNNIFDLSAYFALSAPWVIIPAYMVYVYGLEIIHGLAMASPEPRARRASRKSIVAEVVGETH